MSSSNNATGTTSTTPSTTGTLIGYCHNCDRQVQIDSNDYSCSVCRGGFVELLDEQTTANSQTRTSQTQQMPPQLNPFAFLQNPQLLLSPMFSQLNTSSGIGGAGVSISSSSGPGGGAASGISNTGGGGSRVVVIQPGEQLDIYGMMNNIVNSLFNQPGVPGQQAPQLRLFQIHGDPRDYAWGNNGLDVIITQLLNQLETTGPAPATDTQLNNLPVEQITEEHVKQNAQCAICMDDFKLNEQTKRLPCKHIFHDGCIVTWLRLHGTCPVCRKTLNGEDTSQHEYVRPASANQQQDQQPQQQQQQQEQSQQQPQPQSSQQTRNNQQQPSSSSRNNRNQASYYDEMDFD